MMEESLHGALRLSSLDRRGDGPRRAACRYGATAIVYTLDRTAPQEWPLWPLLGVPLTGQVQRRRQKNIKPLSAILRIVAAIRRWSDRSRSRQELRELNDHLLKDIGIRREELGYEAAKAFGQRD